MRIIRIIMMALSVLSLLQASVWAAQAETPVSIEQILPFAGDDQVRIEVILQNCPPAKTIRLCGKIICTNDLDLLWEGELGAAAASSDGHIAVKKQVKNLKPRLWSTESPILYNLLVTAEKDGQIVSEKTLRFGFRSFEVRGGRFYLNGKPIFLKGNSINPPGRGVPDSVSQDPQFIRDYIRYLKSQNINMIRTSGEKWMDACDELGMLQFGGGIYGTPPLCKQDGPTNNISGAVEAYQEKYAPVIRHPSLVIYTLSNEMSKRNPDWAPFLQKCYMQLKKWDGNRAYIGNAGFGLGLGGEIFDAHPYSGWYHGTFLDYFGNREDRREKKLEQPWTLTECVGSYTVADGRFNIIEKQLATTLTWTGHAPNQTELGVEYQAFLYKQTVELFRRLRSINPNLAGIMPFTILFYHWSDIKSFDDMKPKPVLDQAAVSFQPVLLSWECWTSQVYAGMKLNAFAHVVNDSTDYRDIQKPVVEYWIEDTQGDKLCRSACKIETVPYYQVRKSAVRIDLPVDLETGDYRLVGQVLEDGRVISRNEYRFFVAGQDWKQHDRNKSAAPGICLYDTNGQTAAALRTLGITFTLLRDFSSLQKSQVLVIGDRSVDDGLLRQDDRLRRFVNEGGRVLYLSQSEKMIGKFWPTQPASASGTNSTQMAAASEGMYINPERPDHPIFEGLDRSHLRFWSDYTRWDQSQPDVPKLFPVLCGYRFASGERKVRGLDLDTDKPYDLSYAFGGRKAIDKTAVIADYGRGLSFIALCEIFEGHGSVILSGFDLVSRAGLDPVADRLLINLLTYTTNHRPHDRYPRIENTVHWGDFADERGIIIEKHCGLIPNVVLKEYVPGYADDPESKFRKKGSFNTDPGQIYLIYGRKLIGPYDYTNTCHNVDVEPQDSIVTGEFYTQIQPGSKVLVTRVKNPIDQPAQIVIDVNDSGKMAQTFIEAGKTVEVQSRIPVGASEIHVTCTGTKGLVLLESWIQ